MAPLGRPVAGHSISAPVAAAESVPLVEFVRSMRAPVCTASLTNDAVTASGSPVSAEICNLPTAPLVSAGPVPTLTRRILPRHSSRTESVAASTSSRASGETTTNSRLSA